MGKRYDYRFKSTQIDINRLFARALKETDSVIH